MSEPDHRRGRPHDADGAREAILNAAEEVFAEHGFDGARIDAIAAAAHYNKSLIFQYFGDKLNLYAEVIRRADVQTRDIQTRVLAALLEDEAVLDAGRLRTVLREFGNSYFDYLATHPRITRIYLWELAEGWQTYAKIATQQDYEDIEQFAPVLQKLQSLGLLRPDIDPFVQVMVAMFMAVFYMGLLPIYRMMFPAVDMSSADGLARGREFIMDFIVNGLLPDALEPKPEKEGGQDRRSTT